MNDKFTFGIVIDQLPENRITVRVLARRVGDDFPTHVNRALQSQWDHNPKWSDGMSFSGVGIRVHPYKSTDGSTPIYIGHDHAMIVDGLHSASQDELEAVLKGIKRINVALDKARDEVGDFRFPHAVAAINKALRIRWWAKPIGNPASMMNNQKWDWRQPEEAVIEAARLESEMAAKLSSAA